jgi:hypothetical protein
MLGAGLGGGANGPLKKMALRSSYGRISSYLPPAWAKDLKVIPRAGRVEVEMHV